MLLFDFFAVVGAICFLAAAALQIMRMRNKSQSLTGSGVVGRARLTSQPALYLVVAVVCLGAALATWPEPVICRTADGYFAATSQQALDQGLQLRKQGDIQSIAAMSQKGEFFRLQPGKRIESYTVQPGGRRVSFVLADDSRELWARADAIACGAE